MQTRKKPLMYTFVLALTLGTLLPLYILFAGNNDTAITDTAITGITGSFTITNPARDVTVELWQNSAYGSPVKTQTIPVTQANVSTPVYFNFNDIPSGRYSLVFLKPGHTSFTINDVLVTEGLTTHLNQDTPFPSQLPLRPGNVTGSGQVNISDLSILLQNWMSEYENANFTGTGQINIADLNLLLQNWMAESIVMSALPELPEEFFFEETSRIISDNWSHGFICYLVLAVDDEHIVDGTIFLAADEVINEIDAEMYFDADEGRVTITDDHVLELTIGSYTILADGEAVEIGTAPILIEGEVMLPIDLLVENLGFQYTWEEDLGEIALSRPFQMMRLIVRTTTTVDFTGLEAEDIIPGPDNITVLQFATMQVAEAAYVQLSMMENVLWVEPDTLVTIQQSAALNGHWSWGVSRVGADRYAADVLASGRNRTVIVSVIDTGVCNTHPFLRGRVLTGRCFMLNNDYPYDINGHGTHVAGTIVDNTPGLSVYILPVKVFYNDGGGGSSLNISNAIRWAATRSDVINLSLGGSGGRNYFYESIRYAISRDTTVIVAAGNGCCCGTPIDIASGVGFYPANVSYAITVASSGQNDEAALTTNFGYNVNIAAPGVGIESSIPGGQFEIWNGTSMAAPHVSAAAAMYIMINPGISPEAVKEAFLGYVDVPWGWYQSHGAGILNMAHAPRPEMPQPTPIPTPDPRHPSGGGTEHDPFLIITPEHLEWLHENIRYFMGYPRRYFLVVSDSVAPR